MALSVSPGTSAQIIPHPRFSASPVIQTRRAGRYPRDITVLNTVRLDRRYAQYKARVAQEAIQKNLDRATAYELLCNSLRYDAAILQSQLQRGQK